MKLFVRIIAFFFFSLELFASNNLVNDQWVEKLMLPGNWHEYSIHLKKSSIVTFELEQGLTHLDFYLRSGDTKASCYPSDFKSKSCKFYLQKGSYKIRLDEDWGDFGSYRFRVSW